MTHSGRWKYHAFECLLRQKLKYIALIVFLLNAASDLHAQAVESDRLDQFVDKCEETWRSHSAERIADFFAEDSDMIVGIQPRISGRAEIERSWNLYFSRIDSGRVLSISIESVRILSPNIALLNVDTTTSGTHSETKEVLESRRARGTWVVTRVGGDWKISALRMHSPVGEQRQGPGTDN